MNGGALRISRLDNISHNNASAAQVNMALWRVTAWPLRHLLTSSAPRIRRQTTGATPRTANTTQYCMDIVKRNDYENFLALLLLPQAARASGVAVRAFNVEVAQIQDLTSEALIGKMRLQFWRDTLDQIYSDNAPKQPVAMELYRAIKKHRLSKRWLRSLVDAREEQLERRHFRSIEEIEEYSEKSNAALYYLILQGLGSENLHADHAASHLGKAEGIIKALRGVPHNASKRRVFLPQDIMMKHGVSEEDVIRGSREQNVKDVIYDMASQAYHHVHHARSFMKDVPREARAALLPAVSASTYLTALQKVNFDIFESRLQLRNSWLPCSLLWAKLSKRY